MKIVLSIESVHHTRYQIPETRAATQLCRARSDAGQLRELAELALAPLDCDLVLGRGRHAARVPLRRPPLDMELSPGESNETKEALTVDERSLSYSLRTHVVEVSESMCCPFECRSIR